MKAPADSVHYTVRGVPREVDRLLRKRATQLNKSLNQVIVDELTRATTIQRRRADFSDLTGQWAPDPAFDEILSAQRQIAWDKWS
jgi:hypothetical protein